MSGIYLKSTNSSSSGKIIVLPFTNGRKNKTRFTSCNLFSMLLVSKQYVLLLLYIKIYMQDTFIWSKPGSPNFI